MEEDSGKSIHDQDPFSTFIDLNRAGVALLEMVSEPVIESPEEAGAYLTEVRKLVRYLEICDGNMEEGSLRCDANVSVRLKGAKKLGEKVEVKNMNSISNVQRALKFEIVRQINALENGEKIMQETRSYDAVTGETFPMRTKEMADDYRYFPEPDLPKLIVTREYIDGVRKEMPTLPRELLSKYTKELGLSDYDARVITDSKPIALYFEELVSITANYKGAANWIMGPVKSYLNEQAVDIQAFPISAARLAKLISLVDEGKVSHSVAVQKIFPNMLALNDKDPMEIAQENNWIQESDQGSINEYVKEAIAKYPDKVIEYKEGKKGLIGLFMGEVMKLSKGKADPKMASNIVREYLENN
jgi:aspartyl-tRNA(Asn)/glutamyl-tRNA(Gln) amidotransferase subunit B